MGKASIIVVGGLAVLVGCGTLLDIEPDSTPVVVPGDEGGMPGSDGSSSAEAAPPVDAAGVDAADAAPLSMALCSAAVPPPCVLAENLVDLDSIAVGAGNVYFTRHQSAGAVLQVPSTGRAVTQLLPSALPTGLSATATDLYWVTEGDFQIVRQTFGGLVAASTYGLTVPGAHIAGFGTDTFWTIPGSGASDGQLRVSSPGFNAGAALVLNAPRPTALGVDANHVYYAEKTGSGHIWRMSHTGTSPLQAGAAYAQISALALSGPTTNLVAITSALGVYRGGTESDTAFTDPWVRVSTNMTGVGVVADDATGTLYVLTDDGTLEVIPNGPTPPITTIKLAACAAGTAIAQGGAHVYLACKDKIVRVSK